MLFLNVFILGDEESQFLVDNDSEASASEAIETMDEEISINPQFGVNVGYPTQSGASDVYSTQSGASSLHQTQSGANAGYPKKSRNSAAYPTSIHSAHGAVSQTKPGDSIASSQPGVSGVQPPKARVERNNAKPGVKSLKSLDGVRKRPAEPVSNATMPLLKITGRNHQTQNNSLRSLESVPLQNKVDDVVLKMCFKFMEEFKSIKQHLRVIEDKIEGNQLQEVEQFELDVIPLTSVAEYDAFNAEISANAGKRNALVSLHF
jgi:hypothetical protein